MSSDLILSLGVDEEGALLVSYREAASPTHHYKDVPIKAITLELESGAEVVIRGVKAYYEPGGRLALTIDKYAAGPWKYATYYQCPPDQED